MDLLLPREAQFFVHLNNQVDNFHEACVFFNDLILKLDKLSESEVKISIEKIKEYESKGDKIERFIIMELDKTFITPLDREDINSIAVYTDNCLDLLHRTSRKIDIFKIKKSPPNFVKFSEIILEMSVLFKRLIHNLKNKKEVFSIFKEIHRLEDNADHLFHVALADLFENKSPVEIIKFKDIYQELENISNSIHSVSKIVRGIVVKQG